MIVHKEIRPHHLFSRFSKNLQDACARLVSKQGKKGNISKY